ncbi:hypothetical protein KVT40_003655 [Elsinoe batatas]|uniref:Myb-like domain-containing protein n=1 Tax=Elsinoe batatas TaxID=2601811 RepID=A0A8K0PGQ5_9PEZI|nr:hypothetical protein KVT40_003655 [Elsinoe batatas]
MSNVTFTEREMAVMAAVLATMDGPTFTAEQWKSVATSAGITNGDIGRNAKFAFGSVKKKIGVKGDGAKGGEGGKGGNGKKRAGGDDEDETAVKDEVKDEDVDGAAEMEDEEVEKGGVGKTGRGRGKRAKK